MSIYELYRIRVYYIRVYIPRRRVPASRYLISETVSAVPPTVNRGPSRWSPLCARTPRRRRRLAPPLAPRRPGPQEDRRYLYIRSRLLRGPTLEAAALWRHRLEDLRIRAYAHKLLTVTEERVLTMSDLEIQGQLLPCFQFHVLREVDLWKHGDGVVDGGCVHVECDDAPTRRCRARTCRVKLRFRLQGSRRRWGLIEFRQLMQFRHLMGSRRRQRIEAPWRIGSPWRSNGWGLQDSTRSNGAACYFGCVDAAWNAACYINTMLLRMFLATYLAICLRR